MKAFLNKIKEYDIRFAFSMTQYYHHRFFNDLMMFISSCGDFGMSWLIVILITNMIDVLNILNHCQHISMIFIGGQLNQEGDGFWGTLALEMVKLFKIDKSFLGVVGVDTVNGKLSTYHIDDGMMKKSVIEQSQKSYLLCEERKLKEDGNYIFASLNDISGLIVSKELSNKRKEILEEYGLIIR